MTSTAEVTVTEVDPASPAPTVTLVPPRDRTDGATGGQEDDNTQSADVLVAVEQGEGDEVDQAAVDEVVAKLPRRKRVVPLWRSATRGLVPPDIINHDRPSLRKQFNYAWYGAQNAETGLGRLLSKIYAVLVSLPTSALAYWFEWVCERGGRLLVAYLAYIAVTRIPGVAPAIHAVSSVLWWPFAVWLP